MLENSMFMPVIHKDELECLIHLRDILSKKVIEKPTLKKRELPSIPQLKNTIERIKSMI